MIGPTRRDGAIVYDQITSVADLPRGCSDDQKPASYRLKQADHEALFGYAVGPHSWKKYLFPPRLRLFRSGVTGRADRISSPKMPLRRAMPSWVSASCELAALAIQDRVFNGDMPDPYYARVRREVFIIAVNCTHPGGTCFCASMETGRAAAAVMTWP